MCLFCIPLLLIKTVMIFHFVPFQRWKVLLNRERVIALQVCQSNCIITTANCFTSNFVKTLFVAILNKAEMTPPVFIMCVYVCISFMLKPHLSSQEPCESRGGRPGLSVLTSLLVSVDVKIY